MIYLKDLREGLKDLQNMKSDLKTLQQKYPLRKLMRTKNDGKEVYYKVYYHRKKRIRSVVKHGSTDFYDVIKSLCIDTKLEIIESNMKLLKTLESSYHDVSAAYLTDKMFEKYPKIDAHDIIAAVNELEASPVDPSEWAKADYNKASFIENGRTQVTSRGLKVRSKSEAAICEIFAASI